MMRTTGWAKAGRVRSKKCKYRMGLFEHEGVGGGVGAFEEGAAHFGGDLFVEGRGLVEEVVDFAGILLKLIERLEAGLPDDVLVEAGAD